MCDRATAQRRLEELVDLTPRISDDDELALERNIFAALNAACLAEGEHE